MHEATDSEERQARWTAAIRRPRLMAAGVARLTLRACIAFSCAAVGCTAGEVERRQATLDRLIVQQSKSQHVDGGK